MKFFLSKSTGRIQTEGWMGRVFLFLFRRYVLQIVEEVCDVAHERFLIHTKAERLAVSEISRRALSPSCAGEFRKAAKISEQIHDAADHHDSKSLENLMHESLSLAGIPIALDWASVQVSCTAPIYSVNIRTQ